MKKIILPAIVVIAIYFFMSGSEIDTLMKLPDVHKNPSSGLIELDTSGYERISVHEIASDGLISVILYYEDGCPTCSQYLGYLETLNKLRPDIAIRSVKVPDNIYTDVLYEKYGVEFVKTISFVIVDSTGKIVAADGGYDEDDKENETAARLFWKWAHAENDRQRDPDMRKFRTEWVAVNK